MDARLMVERGDEVHLGRAGIGEAGADTVIGQRGDQRLCTRLNRFVRICHGSLA